MAAHLKVDIQDIAQALVYADDSVEAWLGDGSKILLSSCGSTFTRQERTTKNDVMLQETETTSRLPNTIRQFTAYVMPRYKEKVKQVVTFRNAFAERPFLCHSLLGEETQVNTCIKLLCCLLDIVCSAISCDS